MGHFIDDTLRRVCGLMRPQAAVISRAVMETLEERRLLSVTTLTNGVGDGSLTVTVDAYGGFGAASAGSNAIYNPFGPIGPSPTTFISALYFSPIGGFLWEPDLPSVPFSSVSSTQAVSAFDAGGFGVVLTQRIEPIVQQTTILSQAYQITNNTGASQVLTLVRHVDADLGFTGSFLSDFGGVAQDGRFVFQFQRNFLGDPVAYVGISSSGADHVGFTVQRFPYMGQIISAGGIPAGDLNVVWGDIDEDGIGDISADLTMSLSNALTLAPGETATFTSFTTFGTGLPEGAGFELPSVEFAQPVYEVDEGAGSVEVTVIRSGPLEGEMSVNYTTQNGTARAGLDHVAVSGTLLFADGQESATITVPIIDDLRVEGDEDFRIVLFSAQGGRIGEISSAQIIILDNDFPPTVSSVEMVPMWRGMGIGAMTVTFSDPMHPLRVTDPRSYSILAPRNGDGRLAMGRTHLLRLSAVHYDEVTRTVTLVPRKPLAPNQYYLLAVNGNIGPTDWANNLLDGNGDGVPGGMYRVLFGRGNRLGYIDHDGSRVHLALFRGGVMEVFRRFDGSAQTVSLHGTQEGWSVLRGHVVGVGRTTTLQDLTGDEGILNELQPSIIIASRV